MMWLLKLQKLLKLQVKVLVNNHLKNKNMGVFYPHIQEIEQNENKLSGKMTENKGLFNGYMLDFYTEIC